MEEETDLEEVWLFANPALWAMMEENGGRGNDLDAFARMRSSQTAAVVLEPRASAAT